MISYLSEMKNKTKELDVDFIGGQGALTKDEEKQISEFIKTQKLLGAKQQNSTAQIPQRKKVEA